MKINFFKSFFIEDFISEYSHSNYINKFEDKRFFHMDCSGFVYWSLIQMGYTRTLVELQNFLKKTRFYKNK